jgi:hypothetical protein
MSGDIRLHEFMEYQRNAASQREAVEAERDALRRALSEIALWCEEGGEAVCEWPAQRARAALGQQEGTR